MKTVKKTFTQTLNVYAVPTDQYTLDNDYNAEPFMFEVRTGSCYSTGAVLVYKEEVEITVPAGIDLTSKAVETLESAIEEIKQNAFDEVHLIQQQINNLLTLTHQPEES